VGFQKDRERCFLASNIGAVLSEASFTKVCLTTSLLVRPSEEKLASLTLARTPAFFIHAVLNHY
jgi:hypothetical protein